MSNIKPNFPEGLKRARKAAGYKKQEEFALAIKKSLNAVQKWEQGKTKPSLDDFLFLCSFFECDADYLLYNISEKTHDRQFICDTTGLSSEALDCILSNEYVGRDEAINAMNLLLPGPGSNLFHMLTALSEYVSACQRVHDLHAVKQRLASSESGEYVPNLSLLDTIEHETQRMELDELHAQQNFTFVLEEIRRRFLKNG